MFPGMGQTFVSPVSVENRRLASRGKPPNSKENGHKEAPNPKVKQFRLINFCFECLSWPMS